MPENFFASCLSYREILLRGLLQRVPEKSKSAENIQKVAILATLKLASVSQYSQSNLQKPISRYSETRVDSARKICHQISSVMSSSGGKFSKTVAKNAIFEPSQIS